VGGKKRTEKKRSGTQKRRLKWIGIMDRHVAGVLGVLVIFSGTLSWIFLEGCDLLLGTQVISLIWLAWPVIAGAFCLAYGLMVAASEAEAGREASQEEIKKIELEKKITSRGLL